MPEGRLITPESHRPLLDAGIEFMIRIIDRYAAHERVIAWQVEHEAVDPLGMEHSWRLSAGFAAAEAAAARAADPSRPVLLNGFLPVTTPVAATQWWRTRDLWGANTPSLAADLLRLQPANVLTSHPRSLLLGPGITGREHGRTIEGR